MAFQGTVVKKKIHVLRAIKIISIILPLCVVIRSAMKATNDNFTFFIQMKVQNDNFTFFIQMKVQTHLHWDCFLFSYIFAELRDTKKREFCPGWYECLNVYSSTIQAVLFGC